jgi:glycosyltransferase involved in cell wall biosynthesis
MPNRSVSIVIDNYNYARFLRQAIDSALAQAYRPLEVVVVDDGSTDDSAEIMRSYGDKICAVFKENGGQGSAFNAGFARSTGEIVALLDADDYLKPGAIEQLAAAYPSFALGKMRGVAWENGPAWQGRPGQPYLLQQAAPLPRHIPLLQDSTGRSVAWEDGEEFLDRSQKFPARHPCAKAGGGFAHSPRAARRPAPDLSVDVPGEKRLTAHDRFLD